MSLLPALATMLRLTARFSPSLATYLFNSFCTSLSERLGFTSSALFKRATGMEISLANQETLQSAFALWAYRILGNDPEKTVAEIFGNKSQETGDDSSGNEPQETVDESFGNKPHEIDNESSGQGEKRAKAALLSALRQLPKHEICSLSTCATEAMEQALVDIIDNIDGNDDKNNNKVLNADVLRHLLENPRLRSGEDVNYALTTIAHSLNCRALDKNTLTKVIGHYLKPQSKPPLRVLARLADMDVAFCANQGTAGLDGIGDILETKLPLAFRAYVVARALTAFGEVKEQQKLLKELYEAMRHRLAELQNPSPSKQDEIASDIVNAIDVIYHRIQDPKLTVVGAYVENEEEFVEAMLDLARYHVAGDARAQALIGGLLLSNEGPVRPAVASERMLAAARVPHLSLLASTVRGAHALAMHASIPQYLHSQATDDIIADGARRDFQNLPPKFKSIALNLISAYAECPNFNGAVANPEDYKEAYTSYTGRLLDLARQFIATIQSPRELAACGHFVAVEHRDVAAMMDQRMRVLKHPDHGYVNALASHYGPLSAAGQMLRAGHPAMAFNQVVNWVIPGRKPWLLRTGIGLVRLTLATLASPYAIYQSTAPSAHNKPTITNRVAAASRKFTASEREVVRAARQRITPAALRFFNTLGSALSGEPTSQNQDWLMQFEQQQRETLSADISNNSQGYHQ